MFYEIDPSLIKSSNPELRKRWYRDYENECDLFVWQDQNSKIHSFQFWYKDALLQWEEDKGIKTGKIDERSGAFMSLQSDLFRMHQETNTEIVNTVYNLLGNKDNVDLDIIDNIRNVLYDIAERYP